MAIWMTLFVNSPKIMSYYHIITHRPEIWLWRWWLRVRFNAEVDAFDDDLTLLKQRWYLFSSSSHADHSYDHLTPCRVFNCPSSLSWHPFPLMIIRWCYKKTNMFVIMVRDFIYYFIATPTHTALSPLWRRTARTFCRNHK